MAVTEAQLIAAARDGDAAALSELVARHQSQVYRFAVKMCGDPDEAQDVLQETFLTMARSIRDFRGDASLSTWLYAVTRSFCLKRRRKQPRADTAVGLDERLDASGALAAPRRPDEALADREIERAVDRALRSLDSEVREVLLLRDVEGLTAPEVAEVLGISVPAVKSRLHRARPLLRERVKALGAFGDAAAEHEASAASTACPDVLALYSKHLEDDVSPAVCAQMQHHVERCPRCQRVCGSLKETLAACQRQPDRGPVPERMQQAVRSALSAFLAERSTP